MNQIRKRAKVELMTPEELEFNLYAQKVRGKGGMIELNVYRVTMGGADAKMFGVVIRDTTEKELFRKNFKDRSPSIYGYRWWNILLVNIPDKIRPPFYVYAVDKVAEKPFKYLITAKK